ncbi:hypothetical protein OAH04_00820 [Crocinitomicaceae bacterium]|nr:hypothetical protein [Crocinitomicaceae bacterium]
MIDNKEDGLDDIFDDDDLNILGDSNPEGLFDFKHTPKDYQRAAADFVARRKKCENFDKYEFRFKQVHNEVNTSIRKIIKFNEKHLKEGSFFIHNGIMLLLERINDTHVDSSRKKDGRTRIIFENGTESGMKLRSLGKNLFINGNSITDNEEEVNKSIENSQL